MVAMGLTVAMAYVVMVGGTAIGEVEAELRLVNAAISALIIVAAGTLLAAGIDRVDGFAIAALALFALAGLVSEFPRQSFDAVLAALAYVAAFVVGRRVLARVRARRWVVWGFIGLSALFILLFSALWVAPVLEWWRATGWQVIPPLNFEHRSFPWGHRHDAALLVVILYPAWWIGRPSGIRRAVAIAFGVLAGLIVLVDGSRALWLAMGVATAVLAMPAVVRRARQGVSRAQVMAGVTVGAGVAVLLAVSGVGSSLFQRAMNAATLGYRAELWGAVADAWSSRPIAGFGPGSFPWVLQTTDYFDTNSLAPRHPDSAVVQMLAEGGILGLVALAVLVGGVGVAVMRSRTVAARWVLLTFTVASLNANPTDFAFLIVVAIAWVAYAIPHRVPAEGIGRAAIPYAIGAAVAVAAIGFAYVPTLVAGFSYERGREAVDAGNLDVAARHFTDASGADAGLALYPRQLGTAELLAGDIDAAVPSLESATRINEWDDLAWRTLALAHEAAGDEAAAEAAIARAVDIQRSDPTNLLLAAIIGADDGSVAAEVVQAWPWIVHAAGWEEWLPPGSTTTSVVEAALDRWTADAPMPEVEQGQSLWLAAMADSANLDEAIEQSGLGQEMGGALAAAIRCQPVQSTLDAMGGSAMTNHLYWWLRARDALITGESADEPMRIAELMGRPPPSDASIGAVLNPLHENGQYSTDQWGYRRLPISWPDYVVSVPSQGAGMARWFHEGCD